MTGIEGTDRPPKSSLIICTRNRPEMLTRTLDSVRAGDAVPDEIIVVDQSDEPHPALGGGSPGLPGVVYVLSRDRGLSRAMNEGIGRARHPLLVFTHDDVVVRADWYARLVAALAAEGPRVVLTGRVVPSESERPGGFAPSTIDHPTSKRYRGRVAQDIIYPHNLACHREVFELVGPLDPRLGPGTPYPAAEDNDFCHRVLEAGLEVLYVPDAVIEHAAWRTRSDYLPLRWGYGRGQGAYYAKHLDRDDPYMARRFRFDAGQRLVRVFKRWRHPLGAVGEMVYLAGLLSGALGWMVTQRGNRGETG